MIRLFAHANYDFIKWRRWAIGLTLAFIIPGYALFFVRGLNYSIEFTGGTLIQVTTTDSVGTGKIRSALDAAGIRDAEIQQFGAPNEYVVRARLGAAGVVAEGTAQATAEAVDSALAHGLGPNLYEILHLSINETLPRSVLTHGTTMATTVALVLLAGEVLRPFALVMTFAIFTGTFSSIYIAAPLLMYIEKRWPGQDARGARAFRSAGTAAPEPRAPQPRPSSRSRRSSVNRSLCTRARRTTTWRRCLRASGRSSCCTRSARARRCSKRGCPSARIFPSRA